MPVKIGTGHESIQQVLHAKHLLTNAPVNIATNIVHCHQQAMRAKHLLTSAPAKLATHNAAVQQVMSAIYTLTNLGV